MINASKNRLLMIMVLAIFTLVFVAGCGAAKTPESAASTTSDTKVEETKAPVNETAEKKPKIIASSRNLSNPYWVEWNEGGQEAADALGADYQYISAEDNEQKQLADIEAAIAAGGVDAVVVMPNTDAILPAFADLCEKNKVLMVSMWDKPTDLDPDKYKYWVAHVTQDMEKQGYDGAKTLFEGLGGKGNVIQIEGLPGAQTATVRNVGFEKALKEYPGIKLLGKQTGYYSRFKVTPVIEDFITNYGDQINGVWCANDDSALGVMEAMKAANMIKNVKITGVDAVKETLDAIIAGEMYATLGGDGKGMHGTGVTAAFDAIKGIRPADGNKILYWAPPVVTPENVKDYYEKNITNYKPHPWKEISKFYSGKTY